MPRNRSVRVAALSHPAQRPATSSSLPSRAAGAVRRRAVLTILVLVSLALLSVYFRESSGGALHSAQSTGAAVLRPFEVAGERVARPFQDAADWFGGLLDAKSENARLRKQVDDLRQQLIQNETAARENDRLRALLGFRGSTRFPRDYRGVAAAVISRAPAEFVQQIVVAVGSAQGIKLHAPVVTEDGLVGQVTRVARNVSQVTLLTDETSAVSVADLKTAAPGILRHGSSAGDSLILDRVGKDQVVNRRDVVITAGWHDGPLSSIYPKGIPVGVVTSVGQLDTDPYKQVEVRPFVDFGSLESVIVLVETGSR